MDDGGQSLSEMNAKIDAIWQSVEKTRKYFQWTFWLTIIFFVLPLVALVFVLPIFLNSYLGSLGASFDARNPEVQQLQILGGLLQ